MSVQDVIKAPQSGEVCAIQAALEARENAYCPHSHYKVGSALISVQGKIFSGCNGENIEIGSTICAERHTIGNAHREGIRDFRTMIVATKDGQGFPCGSCRQSITEFSPNAEVVTVDETGKIFHRETVSSLLPKVVDQLNLDITALPGVPSKTLAKAIRRAIVAAKKAHCIYTGRYEGSAVISREGKIYSGCRIENAAYGSSLCAERFAIGRAVNRNAREFSVLIFATKDGESFPCGSCRQVLNEFAPNAAIVTVNERGEIIHKAVLSRLLPHAFGPHNLTETASPKE